MMYGIFIQNRELRWVALIFDYQAIKGVKIMKKISERKAVIAILLLVGMIATITGCSSIGGSSDMVLGFSQPIPVTDLIMGSFTYNSNDKYVVRPDGYLILDRSSYQQEEHEAYNVEVTVDKQGKTIKKYLLKDGYHTASDVEVYAWAHRVAAEKAKITKIIAVRTLSVTVIKSFGGISVTSLDTTVMVYGDPAERL